MKNTYSFPTGLMILITLIIISCQHTPTDPPLHSEVTYPVGTAVGNKATTDSIYQAVLDYDFNSVTAEGLMKMKNIVIAGDSFDFSNVDAFIHKYGQQGKRIHGHTLIWHQSTPTVICEIYDSATLENFMREYIHAYVSRYRGKVASWDVANEAISDSAGLMRKSHWSNVLGPEFVDRAFRYASEADPDVKLFYNDYLLETDTVKLNASLKLVDRIMSKNIKIDGIGFQMHTMIDTPDIAVFGAALDSFVKRDLLVHISELDVRINSYFEPQRTAYLTDSIDQLLGQRYFDVARAYNQHVPDSLQFGITVWGFTDRYTWIRSYYKALDWPCIYDDRMRKKEAWYTFRKGMLSK